MKRKLPRINISRETIAIITLLCLTGLIRWIPGGGEVYARWMYPLISTILSWTASLVGISLEEWIVVGGIMWLVGYPFWARRRKRKAWKTIALRVLKNLCWATAWFYLGWGCNYFRNSWHERMGLEYAEVNKKEFKAFLKEYTDSLNASYCKIDTLDAAVTQEEIKSIYSALPEKCGLCKPWEHQRVKRLLLNRVYSAVGVLGYMGPFMDESQLNMDLRPAQYAFTYAHETAHLLSISSEAEANYWAYYTCRRSKLKEVRYSAYFGLLPYVARNAAGLLNNKEWREWIISIHPEVMEEWKLERKFWSGQRLAMLDKMQTTMYNWFLKGNNISSGMKNYDQVVEMVMAEKGHTLSN